MLMVALKMLLPVIWALVSAAIALLLYKSAKAIFVHERVASTDTRQRRTRLSLGGSVVIGVIAFAGMLLGTRETGAISAGSRDQIGACRDTFLRASATLEAESLDHAAVRARLGEYLTVCRPVIQMLDDGL